jgi:hypothetical protein
MNMKLNNVFSGHAGRSGKPEHHGVINRPLTYIVQQRPSGHPRRRRFSGERSEHSAGFGAGQAHDGDRARRPARRQGENGLIPRMHRLFVRGILKRQK